MRRTRTNRLARFAVGFLVFLAAHAIQVLQWNAWFGGVHQAWFLNSGRAIVFTLTVVFVAGGVSALVGRSDTPAKGVTLAAGSFTAMTIVLFMKKGGPGTIFPIVMVAGGLFILASSTLGAFIGREIGRAMKRQ
jgi:hypothetical protein